MEIFRDFIFEDEEDTQKDKFLTFVCDNETYAIEIRYVTEIIGVPPITVLPDLEDYIKGIINLRGKFIPMLDVCEKLKGTKKTYTDRTCTIVVDYEEHTIGMIIDAVSDVVNIPEGNIIEPPNTKTSYNHSFIRGMGRPALAVSEGEEGQEFEYGEIEYNWDYNQIENNADYSQDDNFDGDYNYDEDENEIVLIMDLEKLFMSEEKGEEDDNTN